MAFLFIFFFWDSYDLNVGAFHIIPEVPEVVLLSKRLLISWLQSPSAVILQPKKIKSVTVFVVSASICQEVMGPDAVIFIF